MGELPDERMRVSDRGLKPRYEPSDEAVWRVAEILTHAFPPRTHGLTSDVARDILRAANAIERSR